MIALAFVLVLLLAIWLAVRQGGVRKHEPAADTPPRSRRRKAADRAANGAWIGYESDLPTDAPLPDSDDLQSGGGNGGGGGASGSWDDAAADSGSSSGDGGGGD